MRLHPRVISYNLDRFATALCQWTVDGLQAEDSEFAARYGPDWRTDWVEDTLARLTYLSQSVAVESPALFLDAVASSKVAAGGDERLVADIRRSLVCLRNVLAQEMPAGSLDIALDLLERAEERFDALTAFERALRTDGVLARTTLRYLEAVLEGDDAKAEDILEEAIRDGLEPAEVFETIVHPAQVEIGRMWMLGEVSIPEEHQATTIAVSALTRLLGRLPRAPQGTRSILVTSVEGELHDVGVRLVSELLRIAGWKVTCLGANVPVADVIECAKVQSPDVIALSVTSTLHVRACAETIDGLRDALPSCGPKILVAGRPFLIDTELWQRIGADAMATSATEAVTRVAEFST
ncbi:MAG: cobalamin B12-binding domain-containing protein [Planctomycetes bacterium]|nr:cobalamin B12-binding domain-containing protein [Planctomycetota bacterium]